MNRIINPAIFHDYDIRGVYPTELNEETYFILGQSIATYLKVKEIAVGYDCRMSSPSLFKALTSGIMDRGTDVINLGQISTEIHYFASGFYRFPANIIISASHNPAQYNGLKIVTEGVNPLHGNFGLPQIKALAIKNDFPRASQKGKMTKKEVMDEWIKHSLTFIQPEKLKSLKVVVDAGNGMGGISWQKIIGKTPVEIIPLYFEPDGHFPHHLADPLKKENTLDLKKAIAEHQADLGFALDGDADRLFVMDEKGNMLGGSVTTAILAMWMLQKYGSSTVLYNAVCGRIVPEVIKKYRGIPMRVRVGHSFIKQYMKKENAVFAGEHSGHFYLRDDFFAESSLICGLLFLEYLSKQNKPLSQIVSALDKYPSSGEINFKTADLSSVMKAVKEYFKDAKSIDELDGLSIWYEDWWLNLRPSKTEPLLRLNLEANNKTVLYDKLRTAENLLLSLSCTKT
ncbi:phosphomannomutase/phosphoglucomutase [Candidatus Microgenomates bacterium]|nr:phosphomannomutase/phosphoglucomutase [Candidatus Microgenomates bacterium]